MADFMGSYQWVGEGGELTLAEELLVQALSGTGFSKTIVLENPSNVEDLSFFKTNLAITITKVKAVLVGTTTPSIDFNIKHATDRNAAGNDVLNGDKTVSSTTTPTDFTDFDDATIPVNSVLWIETSGKTGSVDQIAITVDFTVDT